MDHHPWLCFAPPISQVLIQETPPKAAAKSTSNFFGHRSDAAGFEQVFFKECSVAANSLANILPWLKIHGTQIHQKPPLPFSKGLPLEKKLFLPPERLIVAGRKTDVFRWWITWWKSSPPFREFSPPAKAEASGYKFFTWSCNAIKIFLNLNLLGQRNIK